MTEQLRVYRFDNTFDWFAAGTAEDAIAAWRDYHDIGEGEDAPEPEVMAGDEVTEWSFDCFETAEEISWNDLATKLGPGWLGREE